jgi:hypothetical protein
VVGDHRLAALEGHHLHRLAGPGGQRIGPVQRLRPQFVEIQPCPAQPEDLRRHPVRTRRVGLFDEPDVLQRAQQAVRRAFGQTQHGGDLGQADRFVLVGEQAQHGRGPLDGLHGGRHGDSLAPGFTAFGNAEHSAVRRCRTVPIVAPVGQAIRWPRKGVRLIETPVAAALHDLSEDHR